MSTQTISKRYYSNAKSDLRMIQKFTDALQNNGVVLLGDGDVLTPKNYKVFPDGVRFDCEVSVGLSLYNSKQRQLRHEQRLKQIL